MALLNTENHERVTLRAGVIVSPDVLGGGTEQAVDSEGVLYEFLQWPGLSGRAFVWSYKYPDIDLAVSGGSGRVQELASNTIHHMAVQAARPADFLWIWNGTTIARHSVAADGSLGGFGSSPDATRTYERHTRSGSGDRFSVDGDVMYWQWENDENDGSSLRAFTIEQTSRRRRFDYEFTQGPALSFDVKTVNGERNIAYIGADKKLYFNEKEIADLDAIENEYRSPDDDKNTVTVKDFLVVLNTSDPNRIIAITRRSLSYKPDANTTVRPRPPNNIVSLYDVEDGEQIGVDITAGTVRAASDPTPEFRSLAMVQRSRPGGGLVGVASDGGPSLETQEGVLARIVSQTADKVPLPDGNELREVREVLVDVELRNVDPEFLLNREWYFSHEERNYQMRSMSREGDIVSASFMVG